MTEESVGVWHRILAYESKYIQNNDHHEDRNDNVSENLII